VAFYRVQAIKSIAGRQNKGGCVIGTFMHWDPGTEQAGPGSRQRQAWVASCRRPVLVSHRQLRRAQGFENWLPTKQDLQDLKEAEGLLQQGVFDDVREDGPDEYEELEPEVIADDPIDPLGDATFQGPVVEIPLTTSVLDRGVAEPSAAPEVTALILPLPPASLPSLPPGETGTDTPVPPPPALPNIELPTDTATTPIEQTSSPLALQDAPAPSIASIPTRLLRSLPTPRGHAYWKRLSCQPTASLSDSTSTVGTETHLDTAVIYSSPDWSSTLS